jgi:magnesium transporter
VVTVDNAVHVGGRRIGQPHYLAKTSEVVQQRTGMVCIGLCCPDATELQAVAEDFGLHKLAVEDALHGHQRAELERYGDTLFVVLRPARYLDQSETVEFAEVHVFVGTPFVVTVRYASSSHLTVVRQRMESTPELGPQAVLYGLLDEVVDGYAPHPVATGPPPRR